MMAAPIEGLAACVILAGHVRLGQHRGAMT